MVNVIPVEISCAVDTLLVPSEENVLNVKLFCCIILLSSILKFGLCLFCMVFFYCLYRVSRCLFSYIYIFSTFQAYYLVYKISLSSRVALTQSFILLLQRGYIVLLSYGITVGSWDFCLLDWIPCLSLFKCDCFVCLFC